MTPTEAWQTLGILAIRETRAIRQAYASKLRGLDTDADPEAFTLLRSARDLALQLAENDQIGAGEDEDPAWSPTLTIAHRHDPTDIVHAPVHDIASDRTPACGQEPNQLDRHYYAIEALLLSQPKTILPLEQLTQAELTALRDHLRAVFNDPRVSEITFYGQATLWLANILARACPRSDPVLAISIKQFGWMAGRNQVGQEPAIAFITQRQANFDFIKAVQGRRHPLNSAWLELTTPANTQSMRGIGIKKREIDELLDTIRQEYPQLESLLDIHRVELWECGTSTERLRRLVIRIGVLFALLALIASLYVWGMRSVGWGAIRTAAEDR